MPNARPPDEECASTISPTPEQDLDLARLAIAKGEVRHGAHHLAGVVALDPKRAGLDEALNAWMMLSEDPLAQVPLSDGMFYGAVALHAMVLERIGRPGEAVLLLLQALSAKPDAPFVAIADAWLTPAVAATISGERLSACIVRCLEHAHLRAPLLTMLERIHETQPSDGQVTQLRALIRRGPQEARAAMEKLLDGKLTFTPTESASGRFYEIEGRLALGRVLRAPASNDPYCKRPYVPAAHVSDVVRLFRLALEKGEPGARYHAVSEEGVALRDIAEAIGAGLKMPVESITPDDAPRYFGAMAGLAALDIPASGAATQERLDWRPRGPTLLTDLRTMDYGAP